MIDPADVHPPRPDAHVACQLDFEVAEHVTIVLQVAAAHSAGTIAHEALEVTLDGSRVTDVVELAGEHGGRSHVVRSSAGALRVEYRATLAPAPPSDRPVEDLEAIVARRQSRYCPSDALEGFAPVELGGLPEGVGRAAAIGAWVNQRLFYESGSSGPLDTAIDTLLAGRGVCRDFAHLTVALCRAVGIPARLVAVYAPGLSPMDFHAVAEVAPAGRWEIVDATRLAPRQSLVRIATGRDASDTAFATTLSGAATLQATSITATVDGDLPLDDHRSPVAIA